MIFCQFLFESLFFFEKKTMSFFFGHSPGMWKFLGQGSNLHLSSDTAVVGWILNPLHGKITLL